VLAQAAMAKDGKIDFTGGVTASTCEIKVNNQGNNATVKLPVVSSTLLKEAGNTAGRTFLNFSLTNCSLADNKIKASIFFLAGGTINTAGRLINTTLKENGGTENVQLQILNFDDDLTPLDLSAGVGAKALTPGAPGGQGATPITIDAASKTATIRHYVQYYATGQATAGSLTSSVEYEINYE